MISAIVSPSIRHQIARWLAIAGNITVERAAEPPPKEFTNATHKVTVVLTNVQIKNTKTGKIVILDEIRIEDVWVGWLVG